MLTYALATLRARKASFVGVWIILFCAAAVVAASGVLLETGLRGTIVTERYAAAPIIVAGDPQTHQATVKHKSDKTDTIKHKSKALDERAWLPEQLVSRIEALPGVAQAVAEVDFPACLVDANNKLIAGPDGTPSWGHA